MHTLPWYAPTKSTPALLLNHRTFAVQSSPTLDQFSPTTSFLSWSRVLSTTLLGFHKSLPCLSSYEHDGVEVQDHGPR